MRCTRRVMAALVVSGMVGGCTDPAAVETEAVRLEIVGGDDQEAVSPAYGHAQIGQGAMPESLRVRVTSLAGEPLAGRAVTWLVTAGGTVTPTTSLTDATGHAATHWSLFMSTPTPRWAEAGPHTVRATVAGAPPADFRGHVRTGVTVHEITFTPDTVDVGAGPASSTLSVRIADDRRATTLAFVNAQFYNPTATVERFESFIVGLALTSGTVNEGVWTGTVTIPAGAEPGDWRLGRLSIGWGCGVTNRIELYDPMLRQAGLAHRLHVTAGAAQRAGGASAARAVPAAAPWSQQGAGGC